jgi:hypothetical protein
MKKRSSRALDREVMDAADRQSAPEKNKDLERLNGASAELNAEAADVLDYQAGDAGDLS